MFGYPVDIEIIKEIIGDRKIHIIEDAACGFGSYVDDIHVGTKGTFGCFSFHPRKAISTGEGGMITLNDKKYLNKLEIKSQQPEILNIKGLSSFLSKSIKLNVKVVNKDIVLFKAIDNNSSYSESGIIDRKTGELIHEITKNIKSENSEKDITFYSCSEKENV